MNVQLLGALVLTIKTFSDAQKGVWFSVKLSDGYWIQNELFHSNFETANHQYVDEKEEGRENNLFVSVMQCHSTRSTGVASDSFYEH